MWTICRSLPRADLQFDKLKKDLSFKFEMKDLGEAKNVLGMKIERDRKGSKISLTQKGYLKKVLEVCKYTIGPSL